MPDCDTVVRRSGVNSGNNSRDRINKIIPANDRVNILNSFDYDYYCLASSGSNRNVDYYCYLFDYGVLHREFSSFMDNAVIDSDY